MGNPVYDQDGVGLCYAYAAAQLVDYYRIKNKDKEYDLTNPIFASWVTYYKDRNILTKSNSLTGGGPSHVIDSIKRHGVCEDKDVSEKGSSRLFNIL